MCHECLRKLEETIRATTQMIDHRSELHGPRCLLDFEKGAPDFNSICETFNDNMKSDKDSLETHITGLMLLGYAYALRMQCNRAHMLLRVKGAGDGSHG